MYFSASKLTGGYGGVNIIEDCSFNVNRGEIVSILGPNGAGKSTAMKAMLGILDLKSGEINLDGQDITKFKTQDRIKLGISFVPQIKNIFTELTVEENLEMGAFINEDNIQTQIEKMFDLFPIIKENVDKILLVSEEMIISSMYMIWQRLKIIIEPSCSIVLAALMLNSNKFLNKKVGLILTGGNYDLKQIPW